MTNHAHRNQRATKTSATVSRSHGRPIGKAASRKPKQKLRPPEGGEIRVNRNGVRYIYLPHQQYGWNAWTRCFDNGGTNARKFNDFRDFPANQVVYVNVGSRRSKAAKRYKALGAKD